MRTTRFPPVPRQVTARTGLLSAAAAIGFLLSPGSALASYMANCDALIGQWDKCQKSGGECAPIEAKITAECKCHRKSGNEWKLVTAAVGKNNVCDANLPPPPTKPPHNPGQPPVPPRPGQIVPNR